MINYPKGGDHVSKANFESSARAKEIAGRLYINYSSQKHDFLSNWHHEFEILYISSGKETIYIENDCIEAVEGDIVIINRGRIHTFTGNDWMHHCLIPSDHLLELLGLNLEDIQFQSHIRDDALSASFLRIINEYQSNKKYKSQFKILAIQHFLLELFERFEISHVENTEKKRSSEFLITTKVINYLRQHLAEDFSIDEISRNLGITTSYMCRCVKSATGLSILDHLNIIRCYTAKHLLAHTDNKISDIAAICGYQSGSYFAKTYKKIIGFSPNETPKL